MRYFIDTEFVDTGSTIDLISIGIVSSDGRELYLQSVDFNVHGANEWVKENVLPHLKRCPHTMKHGPHSRSDSISHDLLWQMADHLSGQCIFSDPEKGVVGVEVDCPWRVRKQIRDEVKAFIDVGEDAPEFIGWCSSYDHVALCQLFGTMMDTPINWPHYIRDLQHVLDDRDIPDDWLPDQEGTIHDALSDARHIAKLWGYIVRNDAWQ